MPKGPVSVSRNSASDVSSPRFLWSINRIDGKTAVAEGQSPALFGSRRDEMRGKDRVRRGQVVHRLIVRQGFFFEIKAIDQFPGLAELYFEAPVGGPADKAEDAVGRLLLDIGPQAQRGRQRHAAEADIGQIARAADIDQQRHVAQRTLRRFLVTPIDACRQSLDGKIEVLEQGLEQQVVLETVAAAAVEKQLLFEFLSSSRTGTPSSGSRFSNGMAAGCRACSCCNVSSVGAIDPEKAMRSK